MNRFACSLLIVILLQLPESVVCAFQTDSNNDDGFKLMLNGKDLTGWVLVNTPADTWSFVDGMLVCTGAPIGEIRTEKMYQNFVMEVEWRHLVPKGNAGIFVWADDITAKGQPFHRGIEVQVLENAYGNTRSFTPHGDIFPIHGAKMTPVNGRGGSRAFPTEERAKPSPEWNHYRIECDNGNISLAVNGKVVTQGTHCSPSKGYICIESEGGIVHYRNMKIKELPDTPVDEKDVAIANRGFRSLYTGLDFNGWDIADAAAASWKVRDWTLSFDGNSSGPESHFVSQEKFGDLAFIVDARFAESSSTTKLQLAGEAADQAITIDLASPELAAALDKPGRWNRIEGQLKAGQLSITINDQPLIKSKAVASSGSPASLVLAPVGKVDFANIYVKKL